jgi:hypothetical protein
MVALLQKFVSVKVEIVHLCSGFPLLFLLASLDLIKLKADGFEVLVQPVADPVLESGQLKRDANPENM